MSFGDILECDTFRSNSSRTLRDDLHWLRKTGNQAAHPAEGLLGSEETTGLAPQGLEKVYTIAVEFMAVGGDAPAFALPDEDSSNRMCGDAILRDNAHAQYRLGLRSKRLAMEFTDIVDFASMEHDMGNILQ